MKKIIKIPAFTLTELLVVLTISSVVIGLAYALLTLFNKNLIDIEDNYAENTATRLLKERMVIDFNTYQALMYDKLEKRLVCKSPLDTIVYDFREKLVLRNLDTVYDSDYKLRLFFVGNEVFSGNVDAIKFITKNDRDTYFFISKQNDVAQLLNYGD